MTGSTKRRTYVIDSGFSDEEVRVVRSELQRAGWVPAEDASWVLRWESRVLPDAELRALLHGGWLNHLPGVEAFAVKSRLHDNVFGARAWSGDNSPGIHAPAYSMPDDRPAWLAERVRNPDKLWIKKPKGQAKGRGIELVGGVDDVPDDPAWMVQEYVHRPHLLDGHKYVLRVYLLITSLHPLICYLHGAGVCKLASRPYTLEPDHLSDRFVHLTNPPVQRGNDEVAWGSQNTDLATYRERLQALGIDDDALFERIARAVTKTTIACREDALLSARRVGGDQRKCFDLLGIDVLVDEALTPWVLEYNVGPAMSVGEEYDPTAAKMVRGAKDSSVRDSLHLLGLTRTPMPDGDDSTYWARRLAFEEEGSAGFTRLWPTEASTELVPWFPLPRPVDALAITAIGGVVSEAWQTPRPHPGVRWRALSAGLALFAEQQQRFYWLNDTGGMIWLCLAEGLTPREAAAEWVAAQREANLDVSVEQSLTDVWDLVTAWAQRGLLAGFEGQNFESHRDSSSKLRSTVEVREGTAIVDLRVLGGEGTTPSAEFELSIRSAKRVVFLFDGLRAALEVCPLPDLLDHLLVLRGEDEHLDWQSASSLLEWAEGVEAFELKGSPSVDSTEHAALLNLVTSRRP